MKRRRLGQHFLASPEAARLVADAARLTRSDTVLEIGPGRGALTGLLCERAGRVIAVEADPWLHRQLADGSIPENLELIRGDGFRMQVQFDVLVSSLPYSQSRRAVEWLVQQEFSRAVVVLQREFADKLAALGRNRRAISVLAEWALQVEEAFPVPRESFEPRPGVDSVALRIAPRNRVTAETISAVNRLFAHRRRTARSVLGTYGVKYSGKQRLWDLPCEEVVRIAGSIG